MAVAEGSCEVGTTYYSDIYGYEDDIKILEKVSSDLTGDVIYPIAQIVNKEADKKQTEAAEDFMDFLLSDEAAKVFDHIIFDYGYKIVCIQIRLRQEIMHSYANIDVEYK